MKKAALFDPYLDTLGGGERYLVGVARVLESLNFDVFLEWKEKNIVNKLEKRFGVRLKRTFVVNSIKRGLGFDFCFWFSDGSIPFLLAKKNFIHFQVPFKNVNGRSIKNRIKFFSVDRFIANSVFTKNVIDKEFGISSDVVYPPVDVDSFIKRTVKKENIIISVGRFSRLKQSKGQDILVRVFRRMVDRGLVEGWKLILVGGTEVGSLGYLEYLKEEASGYPIEFLESPGYEELVNLYLRSKIFWTASGFGVDERKDPDKVEHFGITVVEAMASRCFPLACNAGGHKEIIDNGVDGFLWNREDELLELTMFVISKELYSSKSCNLIKKTSKFSYEVFSDRIKSLLFDD